MIDSIHLGEHHRHPIIVDGVTHVLCMIVAFLGVIVICSQISCSVEQQKLSFLTV